MLYAASTSTTTAIGDQIGREMQGALPRTVGWCPMKPEHTAAAPRYTRGPFLLRWVIASASDEEN